MSDRGVHWQPREIRHHQRSHGSSTGPIFVETDSGPAVLKAVNNPQGPHALAREWIGTSLARLLGLRTFDIAILQVGAHDRLPIGGTGELASPGPAFATRYETGTTWSGSSDELRLVRNKDDISGLIVFDTLIRNRDRWPGVRNIPNHDNVFLARVGLKGAETELVAMDHTHCLTTGDELLSKELRGECAKRDRSIFGAFPAFAQYWTESATREYLARLGRVVEASLNPIMREIPREWEISREVGSTLTQFLVDRARFVSQLPIHHFQPQEARP